MSHPLYEQLENAGLLHDRRVDERRALRLSRTRIVDIADQAAVLTIADVQSRDPSSVVHAASLSLGGGCAPCSELGCRRRRLGELARFAAFYSDRVYLHNFLADHGEHGTDKGGDLGTTRQSFLNDLRLLAHIRPLVDAGRLAPIVVPAVKCPHCVAIDTFGAGAGPRSVEAQALLRSRYLNEMQVTLEDLHEFYDVSWTGPEDLLEHGGGGRSLDELPEGLANDAALRSALSQGSVVTLDPQQRQLLGLPEELTADVLRSLSFEMTVSQALRASFVTEFGLEVQVLNQIAADRDLAERNRIVEKHLTSLVPFAGDVPIARLLELRAREEESFLVFRRALTQALDEYRGNQSVFTERDAQQLYQDLIAPQLAQLDQRVKTAKKGIVSQFARDAAGWTAAITLGIWTGIVPAGAVAAAKLLGLTKVAADLISSGLKSRSSESAIANEEFYFLWKVRQASRR